MYATHTRCAYLRVTVCWEGQTNLSNISVCALMVTPLRGEQVGVISDPQMKITEVYRCWEMNSRTESSKCQRQSTTEIQPCRYCHPCIPDRCVPASAGCTLLPSPGTGGPWQSGAEVGDRFCDPDMPWHQKLYIRRWNTNFHDMARTGTHVFKTNTFSKKNQNELWLKLSLLIILTTRR